MSPGDVFSICPADIWLKTDHDLPDIKIKDGDWDITRRLIFTETAKYQSIVQHFIHGIPWIETEIFQTVYADRFKNGERIRFTNNLQQLARMYDEQMDRLYESLKTVGFQRKVPGFVVTLPQVHIGRGGEVIVGNQGNHRLGMAKVLQLSEIPVKVYTVHAAYRA